METLTDYYMEKQAFAGGLARAATKFKGLLTGETARRAKNLAARAAKRPQTLSPGGTGASRAMKTKQLAEKAQKATTRARIGAAGGIAGAGVLAGRASKPTEKTIVVNR
jgi:hypothetical protein